MFGFRPDVCDASGRRVDQLPDRRRRRVCRRIRRTCRRRRRGRRGRLGSQSRQQGRPGIQGQSLSLLGHVITATYTKWHLLCCLLFVPQLFGDMYCRNRNYIFLCAQAIVDSMVYKHLRSDLSRIFLFLDLKE